MSNTSDIRRALEAKTLWLSSWMIHHANNIRAKGRIKVGGHQASSASMNAILNALYFDVLRPEDRVAVKPHASPVFHAIQYLLGNQSRQQLQDFRAFGGAQPYPSRTKDHDDVDFSTGSVGMGVAMTAFASMTQDYLAAHGWLDRPKGRMIALVGDAELDEGNIYEALLEGAKYDLRNCWWIIDYNRQSLDGVVTEGLNARFRDIFVACGWEVVELKYGLLMQDAFKKPGGAQLKKWIDGCDNGLYSALTFKGGAAWRARLEADFAGDNEALALVADHDEAALSQLMGNLAGHDAALMAATMKAIDHDRPVCFICYTVKGHGLPLAGHKDNHAGIMTTPQIEGLRDDMGIEAGAEWEPFAGLHIPEKDIQAFLDDVPFNARGRRRYNATVVPTTEVVTPRFKPMTSTQEAFGQILAAIATDAPELAERIVTTSPDVSVSTNLGPWINKTGLFAKSGQADVFRDHAIPSTQKWQRHKAGRHIELGIAENNLFTFLGALGLSHSLFGQRLLPVGTVYDPFICRGLDALNYACYQDTRFMFAATPSGVSLSHEGGAHQSISTPLIGMAQDGLATFEPAYADELEVIMRWGFDYMQRDGANQQAEETWLRDEKGGSLYLRLSTLPQEQLQRDMTATLATEIVSGGYWLRPPTASTTVVLAYCGALAPEAINAAGLLAEDMRDVAVLAVTSADRLNAGWQAAERARQRGDVTALSHVEKLLGAVPRDAGLVSVIDGHPATLSWLGGVFGHRTKSLGVEHFGQAGMIEDMYHLHGLDANAIMHAARALMPGRGARYLAPLAG
ncbi:Pyruvate dehydrogenase E1 component [Roseobacter fucihabitans]|uniref:Pyruvate dehydrogenase E1 component n=1 Tax=Roseobacter fucihabitans TaxID=1537242 RepID=A0ABZ2BYK3_9RHOB|nr:transketolase [Roseobacter litoralis]MBC6968159.1 Pyruvate dehydrogenase E1 component [Roseobacter litoralis]